MQWSDVTKRPDDKTLRQFAGLCLVALCGLAAWRAWHGHTGWSVWALAGAGAAAGGVGLWMPAAMRFIYTGWMVAAFPIGWVMSQTMLVGLFFVVFTPAALVIRLIGRDALKLRRAERPTHWLPRPAARSTEDYLRQS